jgi:hypothetical protein
MSMKLEKKRKRTDRSGSTFDSFLEQEGIREEVEAVAIKRVMAGRLAKTSTKPLRKRLNRSANR